MLCFSCYEEIPEGVALKVILPSGSIVYVCEECLQDLNFPKEVYGEKS